jgi:hypothetical protein
LESEIANFAGRKTGLIIPIWLADRRSDGLEQEKQKKAFFGDAGFGGSCFGCSRESHGGEKTATHTLPEGHLFLDLIGPDPVQKMGNSGTCFENTRIMWLFQVNTADYRFKMYANRRVWKADHMRDRPILLVREQNTAIGGCVLGHVWSHREKVE